MANYNSTNTDISNNADGMQIAGGIIKRTLKWLGADVTLSGVTSGVTHTLPSVSTSLVGNFNTPLSNQIAIWSGSTLMKGDANLTWDGSKLVVSRPSTGTVVQFNSTGNTDFVLNAAATFGTSFSFTQNNVLKFYIAVTDVLGNTNQDFHINNAVTGTRPFILDGSTDVLTLLSLNAGGMIKSTAGALAIAVVGTDYILPRVILNISGTTTGAAALGTDYVYLCTGTFTYTQPTAVSNINRYTIKNAGTGVITVAFTSAQTGDGGTTLTINPSSSIDLIADNTNWLVI